MKTIRPWLLVVGVLAMVLAIASLRLDLLTNLASRSNDRALEAAARAMHGTVGRRMSERKQIAGLSPALQEFVAGVKKASPKAKVDSTAKTTIGISDSTPMHTETSAAGQPECVDAHNRFRIVIPSTGECAVMSRRQIFELEQVFVRSPDGKVRVAKGDFREFDPKTGDVIPTEGIDMKADFTFMDEVSKPPMLHLRPLAAVDHRLAPGAGVEFLNFERTEKPVLERLTGSVLGYYKDNEGRIVGQLGYRVYGNVTVGPYGGVSTKGGTVVGVGAAIQVGR